MKRVATEVKAVVTDVTTHRSRDVLENKANAAVVTRQKLSCEKAPDSRGNRGLVCPNRSLLDDLGDAAAGGDHRQHVLLVRHVDVQHERPVALDHLDQGRVEVVLL